MARTFDVFMDMDRHAKEEYARLEDAMDRAKDQSEATGHAQRFIAFVNNPNAHSKPYRDDSDG